MDSRVRQTLAVVFGVFVVTAPMATIGAAGSASTPSNMANTSMTEQTLTNSTQTRPTNTSAFAYRVTAYEQLREAMNQTQRPQPKLVRLQRELNETFQHHRDPHRVSNQTVFLADKRVAASLAEQKPEISAKLVDADQRLAETSVADAERVLATVSNRSVSFDRAGVTKSLQKARRALQQGNRLHQKGNSAASITHYQQAWTHAQTALDVMDTSVGPTVTITNRSDSARNDSANYTIKGTVFALDPSEIDSVTVVVNGKPRDVRVRPGTVPGATRSFAATVRLDARVANLTVIAEDPETTRTGQPEQTSGEQSKGNSSEKHADKEKKHGKGDRSQRDSQQTGRTERTVQTDQAVLFLDGDGLSDHYERNETETDPLKSDSASAATEVNESGDGTHDGLEDYDDDGLVTLQERGLRTDPLDADTDDDRLSDHAEVVWTDTRPLAVDSDGNGVSDAREDFDNDTLVNWEEVANNADPHKADTDSDGLRDPAELDIGTQPHVFDTDGDGLGDHAERHDPFNTDPLAPDTDGDGTVDGNETYTTEAANESVGATVSLTGEGNAAQSVTIQNQTATFQSGENQIPAASSVIDIETEKNFSTANITLQYNTSEFTGVKASDLAVFRYDPERQTFVKLDSEVDTANHTVTAETSHFSIYTVLPTSEWESRFDTGLPSPWSVEKEFDYLGSWECNGNCLTEGGILEAGDLGSDTSSVATSENDSTGGFHVLCVVLPGYSSCDVDGDGIPNGEDPCPETFGTECGTGDDDGGTGGGDGDTGDGDTGDGDDGTDNDDPEPTQHTEVTRTYTFNQAREITVQLRVKGSVEEADSSAYVELGDRRVFEVASSSDSASTGWQTINAEVSEYAGEEMTVRVVSDNQSRIEIDSFKIKKHSDADSIPDNTEEEGMPTGWGFDFHTDPTKADTDSDGLFDDKEVFIDQVHTSPLTGKQYYGWQSSPKHSDFDNDSLSDPDEIGNTKIPITTTADGDPLRATSWGNEDDVLNVDSNPLFADTDGDSLTDDQERELETNPRDPVTYAVTQRHQRQVVDELNDRWERHKDVMQYTRSRHEFTAAESMGLLQDGEHPRNLKDIELTDATDDFDFVTADNGDITFVALDNELRTDTWLSNQRELGSTDPWDPDEDNDGLTDGQEVKGLTITGDYGMHHIQSDRSDTYHTSPTNRDTDGDGYWDGWIGVYGEEDSRKVILYEEHLRDDDSRDGQTGDDGLTPSERIPSQAGIHDVSKAPSAIGADVDNDGLLEHSNIHIGELQWGTNPAGGSTPTPSLSLEVDYYNGTDYQALATGSWEKGVEDNYALYGISVDIIRDEVFTKGDIPACLFPIEGTGCVNPSDGWSYSEIYTTSKYTDDEPSDEHVMVVNEGDGLLSDSQSGVNLALGYTEEALFVRGLQETVERASMDRFESSPYGTKIAYVAALTQMHEAGHAMNIGRADDRFNLGNHNTYKRNGEVYSGELISDDGIKDRTPEEVRGLDDWSIMAGGFANADTSPMEGHYFAFSIEELSTVKA